MASIVIAYGCQIRDEKNHAELINFLNDQATSAGPDTWTHPKSASAHTVKIVYDKAAFAAALDQEGAIVVYDGHSRIGQGPAFGPASLPECPADKTAFPLNPWENHFRMGHDLADIECLADIMHHGINPMEYSLPSDTKSLFASKGLTEIVAKAIDASHPQCWTPGGWRAFSSCKPKFAAMANCRADKPLAGRHFWRARKNDSDFDTLVAVGDADLAKTKLACAILFMNSCSSKKHFHAALTRHKTRVKSSCVFFLTAESCDAQTTLPFLKAVLAGKDPAKDAKDLLRRLNGVRDSGFISLET